VNLIRQRAKDNFPTVLLSILGIMQALALEILWSKIQEIDYLFDFSMVSVIAWGQIVATFLVVVIVWVIYSSSAMRLRWVPSTIDSVFPFLVGLLEFTVIENIDPYNPSIWLMLIALVFVSMYWVSHSIMRSARRDPDNTFFFKGVLPAKLSDFRKESTIVITLALTSCYFLLSSNNSELILFIPIFAVNVLLLFELYRAEIYWARSTAEEKP